MPVSRAPADATQPAPTAAAPAAKPPKPAWQRDPWFRFLASVKLAVVLLAVLIVASIAGTIYETSFDAKVARAYIYNAWWFNGWLTLVCINLACAAFSRWPWQRHHTGFLITHLGIILLLVGAMIGRRWGIEGTMTLFRGQPPNNRLLVDQRVLRLWESGNDEEGRQYPVEIIGRRPTPARPWRLGKTVAGWDIELIDYAPALESQFRPKATSAAEGGQPAVRVRLVSKRLGQQMEQWLLAGDQEHTALDLGLASVQVRAGVAPEQPAAASSAMAADVNKAAAPASTTPPAPATVRESVDERVIAFANKPDAPVSGGPAAGGAPSGASVKLTADAASGTRQVLISLGGATWALDPDADRGKDEDLTGSGLRATVETFWPDFAMRDGQPVNASEQPNNPAVLVRLHGNPAGSAPPSPTAGGGAAQALAGADLAGVPPVDVRPVAAPNPAAGAAPGNTVSAPGIGSAADNQALVFCDERGALTYTLKSSAAPAPLRGTLAPGQAVNTGWADWQLTVVESTPAAFPQTFFQPAKVAAPSRDDQAATSGDPGVVGGGGAGAGPGQGNTTDGLRVRLSRGGETHEEWAPTGWRITLPTVPRPTRLEYDFLIEPLPIGLELKKFHVAFNEGTDNPASFQSDLAVQDVEGGVGTGSCSMNQPFNYPGNWWNTFTGLTFKVSQASWNPQNLDQSVVQVLRDPGWFCKWTGSLLICGGIFTMFYLRPARG